MQLILEAIAVGIITMIFLIIISYLLKGPEINGKFALIGFLTGAAVHVGMEYTGGNDWYCNYKLKKD
jgi:hypothetical protein